MSIFPSRKDTEISAWRPFEEMASIHDRINNLFNRFGSEDLLSTEQAWMPLMDVVEKDKEIELKLDVPGMERKDLTVEMDDGNLTIRGERKRESKEEKDNYVHIERGYGAFMRRFPLPDYVNREDIKATCKDGILRVTLAKIPGKKKDVKKISIN